MAFCALSGELDVRRGVSTEPVTERNEETLQDGVLAGQEATGRSDA